MELPLIIARLVEAQNTFDSKAYADCFTDAATVHDEGKTHAGKPEIYRWIEESNEKYRSVMTPLQYEQSGANGTLTTEVSGTFPGSPLVLKFHFSLKDNLIDSLKVTG